MNKPTEGGSFLPYAHHLQIYTLLSHPKAWGPKPPISQQSDIWFQTREENFVLSPDLTHIQDLKKLWWRCRSSIAQLAVQQAHLKKSGVKFIQVVGEDTSWIKQQLKELSSEKMSCIGFHL